MSFHIYWCTEIKELVFLLFSLEGSRGQIKSLRNVARGFVIMMQKREFFQSTLSLSHVSQC